ncbi:dCTP deaminase [Nonomuraea basaltis]|nr:dCTP deaminase [Nonomuraea basaltis]
MSAWEADVLPLNYTRARPEVAPPTVAETCPTTAIPGSRSFRPGGRLLCVLLSDRDILAEIEAGRLALDPFHRDMIQPSSIDVRLDRFFRVFENHRYPHIDPSVEQPDLTRMVEPDGDEPFILHPGEFVLASTYEMVTLSDALASRLEGKSSLGRLGLLTHSTAGFIDPGFSGHVTLELSNVATLPIKLWPGMKIGQLCVFKLSSPAEHPYGSAKYGSRYQGQRGPTPSRSFRNFHRTKI